MAKKEISDQLKSFESYINDIPLVIDLKKLNGIYSAMKDRCYYCKDRYYKDYGGRGITICDEWLNKEVVPNTHNATKGWLAFKNWAITNGYKKGLTIDRIDVNKGYSPDNCRWITPKEQANNRRSNHFIIYNGVTKTISEWADYLGINQGVLYQRLKKAHFKNIEICFTTPVKSRYRLVEYNGKIQPLQDLCNELGLNFETVRKRLDRLHWSVEKALEIKTVPRKHLYTYKGKTQSLADWCKELHLNYSKINSRLCTLHWSVEKAFETE